MNSMTVPVSIITILTTFATANVQCPANFVRLSTGVQCYTNEYCSSLANGYTCENNVCCMRAQRDPFCPVDQISIGGICYGLVNINEPCAYSPQCRGTSMQCLNGFCRNGNEISGSCMNPSDVVERDLQTQKLKNCLDEPCSQGFVCEYTSVGRYQCCGQYTNNVNYNYGVVKMYPGTTLPLVCKEINSCLFVDTPNCVYSSRYRCNICCSTWNC